MFLFDLQALFYTLIIKADTILEIIDFRMTKIIIIFAIFTLATTLAKPWAPYYGTDPPTDAPTDPPMDPPTEPPTDSPTEPPTPSPTYAPTHSPTPAPTKPPPYHNHHKRRADGYGAPMPPPTPAPPYPTPAPGPIVTTAAPPPQPSTPDPPPIVSTPAPPPIVSTPAPPPIVSTLAPPPIVSTPAPTPEPQTENLIQVLTKKGNFQQLIKAITDLKLIASLDSIDSKTIFAPNDAAFAKITDVDFVELTDPEKIIIIKR